VTAPEQEDDASSHEICRIQAVYAEREQMVIGTIKADAANRGNLHLVREYRGRLAQMLHSRVRKPLSQCRILDVGCGYGSLLGWCHEQGATATNLFGVDLLANRVVSARTRYPDFSFFEGNAERLDFPDGGFDLVSACTVFSSILDKSMAVNVAGEIRRVLAPDGAVVWYDVRYANPWNRNLKGMRKPLIQELFPRFRLELQTISMVPPLARRLGPCTDFVYRLLALIPLLRTHYVGLLRPPLAVAPGK
jgi:SAM-dependent methyltransferase